MLDRKLLIAVVILLLLLSIVVALPYFRNSSLSPNTLPQRQPIVPLNQIIDGGPPKDGIPSIDSPKFVAASNASFLSDNNTVIGIYYKGVAKAYPLLIMVWHEIVNDIVGGTPVAITYCPLCYSSLAFIRQVNGTTVTFGTTGKLYNNNLVMYDRLTQSYWSQMWGEAITGELTGYKLIRLPIDVLPWGDWKNLYPNTLVLSEDTGFDRPYGTDPYSTYYASQATIFPLSSIVPKIYPPKTLVLGVSIDNVNKSYPLSEFNRSRILTDSVGIQSVVFFIDYQGTARVFDPALAGQSLNFQNYSSGTFIDLETHSVWNYDGVAISGQLQGKALTRFVTITAFWFAWATFYQNTSVYSEK